MFWIFFKSRIITVMEVFIAFLFCFLTFQLGQKLILGHLALAVPRDDDDVFNHVSV